MLPRSNDAPTANKVAERMKITSVRGHEYDVNPWYVRTGTCVSTNVCRCWVRVVKIEKEDDGPDEVFDVTPDELARVLKAIPVEKKRATDAALNGDGNGVGLRATKKQRVG